MCSGPPYGMAHTQSAAYTVWLNLVTPRAAPWAICCNECIGTVPYRGDCSYAVTAQNVQHGITQTVQTSLLPNQDFSLTDQALSIETSVAINMMVMGKFSGCRVCARKRLQVVTAAYNCQGMILQSPKVPRSKVSYV
jgi:hypothetical protein